MNIKYKFGVRITTKDAAVWGGKKKMEEKMLSVHQIPLDFPFSGTTEDLATCAVRSTSCD